MRGSFSNGDYQYDAKINKLGGAIGTELGRAKKQFLAPMAFLAGLYASNVLSRAKELLVGQSSIEQGINFVTASVRKLNADLDLSALARQAVVHGIRNLKAQISRLEQQQLDYQELSVVEAYVISCIIANGSPDLAPYRLFHFSSLLTFSTSDRLVSHRGGELKKFTETPSEVISYVMDTHFEKPKEADNENKELDNSLLELDRVNAGARRGKRPHQRASGQCHLSYSDPGVTDCSRLPTRPSGNPVRTVRLKIWVCSPPF